MNVGLRLISTPLGSVFFGVTKPLFRNRTTGKWADAWWYGYLFWLARRCKLEKLKKQNKGYRLVKKLRPDYDYFLFYNTVFHLDYLSHIVYELSQGYIPLIDDTWHVWEQFLSSRSRWAARPRSTNPVCPYPMRRDRSIPRSIFPPACRTGPSPPGFLRDFCRFRPEVDAYNQKEIHELLDGRRVLAVIRRGTDYIGTGIPAQPEMEEMIREARQWMETWHYDLIYLATEDEWVFDQFNAAFPGQILVNKRSYYDKAMAEQNTDSIGRVHFNCENDNYLKGLEYLSSIYIASSCQDLLAGFCGASNIALALNQERYEHWKVY